MHFTGYMKSGSDQLFNEVWGLEIIATDNMLADGLRSMLDDGDLLVRAGLIIPFLNQNRRCRLRLAVLFILSAARLRVVFDLEMELEEHFHTCLLKLILLRNPM
jgi:hypothetical protein